MEEHIYYIGLDVGTTNWKAALFTETGKLVDIERCPTMTHTDAHGHSYYDPHEMWGKFVEMMRAVVARNPVTVRGISVASVAEAVVPVDSQGNTIDNIITWYDTRSFRQAQQIRQALGEEKVFSICGLDCNPIFSLPKVMWVRENRPQIFRKAAKWLQMADYVVYRLTGELVTDYTLASRTLAFDVAKADWSEELLSAAGLSRDIFPRIVESGTPVGHVRRELCEQIGFRQAPIVAVGGHDHPAASIAAGAVRGGKVLDSSGTAEAYLYISEKNAAPNMKFDGQRTCRYLQKDRYVLWGGIIASGRSFDWAYELLASDRAFFPEQKLPAFDEILPQLEQVRGIEDGLVYYPHIRGAGAPHWDPRMRGAFVGVRDYMDGRHFLRAVLEGLSMQSRMIVDMQERVSGEPIRQICVVGGSSKNRLWQQLKANITGRSVELCFEPEATALGAAMLAAIADGTYDSIEQVSDLLAANSVVITPEDGAAERYEPFFQLYREGYTALEQFNAHIHSLTNQ